MRWIVVLRISGTLLLLQARRPRSGEMLPRVRFGKALGADARPRRHGEQGPNMAGRARHFHRRSGRRVGVANGFRRREVLLYVRNCRHVRFLACNY